MTERLSSGRPRLDAILDGGLPANAITLIAGLPGSGKTILTQQYVFANATAERPAVYFSTVFEPFDKLIRYVQTLDFFDAEAIGTSVFYEDLGPAVAEGDPAAVLERIEEVIKESRPAVIVIDSFKALSASLSSRDYARLAWQLAARLAAFPTSSFWVGGYALDQLQEAPEYALADAVLHLSTERTAEREIRLFNVLKLRGSSYLPGKHAFRVSTAGIDVFPRLADKADQTVYDFDSERASTGVEMLDEVLGGGLLAGSSTLVAGPSGIGKTLLGLHFVLAGSHNGDRAVVATLQENPSQLARVADSFGWSLTGNGVELMYRSPVDVHVDEWVYDLLDTIERTGARRVLIDSLSDLQAAAPDASRFREYLYSLAQRCSRHGVSLLMTAELPELFHVERLSDHGVSHFCDNVIILSYDQDGSELRRKLYVLKTRASAHRHAAYPFEITAKGITPPRGSTALVSD